MNSSLTSATGNKYVWYIPCNRTSILECEIVNSCGTSTKASLEEVGGCRQLSGSYIVAPNPAANTVTVSPTELNSTETANITIDEVRVYDLQGNLKKHQKFNKVKKATLNINDLKTGNYTIEVIGVNFSEKKQLLIRR